MKNVLILGAGTAGTMVANKLRRRLDHDDWKITIVDQDDQHHYQPGYLFVPFGRYDREDIVRSRHHTLADGIDLRFGEINFVDADQQLVTLRDEQVLSYDFLVIATGCTPRPDQTPGMLGPLWRHSIFDFYTLEGAEALANALTTFDHGNLVVHITETPIKCPVAPLEFTFLIDAWLRERGLRDRVELTYVTPLDGAFTRPVASAYLGTMLDERKIHVETDFMVERVDEEQKALVSYDEREIPFDLLVTIPLNMGADYIARSGLGDELNYVPVDQHTLQSTAYPNVFVVGDASNIPASKAGSVAHFSSDVVVTNLVELAHGHQLTASFDGHANCFVESGSDEALLIDFNYETEPLPGKYPLPVVGPLTLLKPTRANHLGKLAFRHLYWHALLPGFPLPVPKEMSMAGKHVPETDAQEE